MYAAAYNPAYVPEPIVFAQCGGAKVLDFTGDKVVNGVRMPAQVIQQLRAAGISLHTLSHYDLEDAVREGKDGKVIENPGGITFHDKLEKPEQRTLHGIKRKKTWYDSYAEKIKAEREAKDKDHGEEPEPSYGVC